VARGALDRLAVTLPLSFPDAMVSDDVSVTASVRDVLDASASTRRTTFRPARTPRFDFVAPVLGAPVHTLVGDEDRYDVLTTAVLPPRVTGLVYTLGAPTRFRHVAEGGCTVGAGGLSLRCADVRDGDHVTLPVAADGLTTGNEAGIRVSPVDRFVDPAPGNNTAALTIRPGADLGLSLPTTSPDPGRTGLVTLSGGLTGLRPGLDTVTYTLSSGARFLTGTAGDNPGCTSTDAVLTCPAPVDGNVTLTVASATPELATPVTVSVSPSPPFEPVGTGPHTGDVTLPGRLQHDFSLTGLDVSAHTLVPGHDADRYLLTAKVGALPVSVRSVAFAVAGGATFATDQPDQEHGCSLDGSGSQSEVRCTDVASEGQVTLAVESALPQLLSQPYRATVSVLATPPFEDVTPNDDSGAVTLVPGVDLHLAGLAPDDEPSGQGPRANRDDNHVVTADLSGVRRGVASLSYALTGRATLAGVVGAVCSGQGTKALTCQAPSDGVVRFQVASDASSSREPVGIELTASAPEPFVELDPGDNVGSTTLAARPSYNFAMGPLTLRRHTVDGDGDVFALSSTVQAPDGVGRLTFVLESGGAFTESQAAQCRRVDATHLACDPDTSGAVELRVASSPDTRHAVQVRLELPTGYRDPPPHNNSDSIDVTPGVDLHLGPLTPGDPVPTSGAYVVSSDLTGVRSGPVTFELTGQASITDVSCADATAPRATRVTCDTVADDRKVTFTIAPTTPRASTTVTIRAQAGDLTELAPADNAADTTLAPDVTISSLSQSDGSNPLYAVVRAQVTGVPVGVSTVRLHLTGPDVGIARLRFTTGANGADGEGPVDCFTSDSTGRAETDDVYVTCTGVANARAGRFFVDTRVARLPLASSVVTFTVVPVDADEGAHGANNSRSVTLHLGP
jgi:hypothetical protein